MMMKYVKNLIHQIEEDRRYQIAVMVLIILLGAALRFYKLGAWSLWVDEVFTINRANAHVNIKSLLTAWWHPSISLILTRGSMELFGFSPWSARLAPTLIGIISLPLVYHYTRRWFGVWTALIAVLLLAIAPWHLEWSQNARYYTGQLLFLFLASYYFYQALESNRPTRFLLAGFWLALAVAERFTAIFFFPVAACYLLVLAVFAMDKPAGFNRRNLLLLGVPLVVFALVEIIRFALTRSSYLVGALDLSYNLPIDDPFRLGLFIAFNIGMPLTVFGVITGFYLFQKRDRAGLYIFLNAIVPIVLLLFINPFYFTKGRYIFMVLPFWMILAGIGIEALYRRVNGYGRLLVLGVLFLMLFDAMGANVMYYTINHGNRNNWQQAFDIVHSNRATGDRIVTWWTELGPYYTDEEIISWGDVYIGDMENARDPMWFILDEETIWLNPEMQELLVQEAELIEVIYQRRLDDAYIRIYYYTPSPD